MLSDESDWRGDGEYELKNVEAVVAKRRTREGGGWLARHSTIKEIGRHHCLDMGAWANDDEEGGPTSGC